VYKRQPALSRENRQLSLPIPRRNLPAWVARRIVE